jgi:hypothetical protein
MSGRTRTEAFLLDLVTEFADVVIFAPNEFSWLEQREVFSFQTKCLQSGRQDLRLGVVHKLKAEAKDERAAGNLFSAQLMIQDGSTGSIANGLVSQTRIGNLQPIYHYGFLHEASGSPRWKKRMNAKTRSNLVTNLLDKVQKRQQVPLELLRAATEKVSTNHLVLGKGKIAVERPHQPDRFSTFRYPDGTRELQRHAGDDGRSIEVDAYEMDVPSANNETMTKRVFAIEVPGWVESDLSLVKRHGSWWLTIGDGDAKAGIRLPFDTAHSLNLQNRSFAQLEDGILTLTV